LTPHSIALLLLINCFISHNFELITLNSQLTRAFIYRCATIIILGVSNTPWLLRAVANSTIFTK
jgi:hypothetical protein